ncbi:hypothetical protein Sjap_015680 [Stephania japonica]|uniref:Uncharacterized protein n=1 Tax=Stephania japonica TaxID=461633 RepID=A0AAP0IKN9_9MAGN
MSAISTPQFFMGVWVVVMKAVHGYCEEEGFWKIEWYRGCDWPNLQIPTTDFCDGVRR